MSWQHILFPFFGGLGLFLFAIKLMGDGLQNAAGNKLRYILDKFTSNPFKGIVVGILVTILVQSSTATSVIVVSLVGAGLMNLRQSIGVIMGANIGTTTTAFIVGFNIGEYAYPFFLVGAVLLFFTKTRTLQSIGEVIFGFAGLFVGIELMSSGLSPLQNHQFFTDLMLTMSGNPLISAVIGLFFTVIVQSSAATIGILQGLYAEHLIDLNAALPLLLGNNLGTTITALLAAIGVSVVALRAATVHILINVCGVVLFMLFLVPYHNFVIWLGEKFSLEPMMQIAFAHGTYNILNVVLQLPLIGVWAYVVTKLIPDSKKQDKSKVSMYLDETLISKSSTIAVGQARKEVLHMGDLAIEGMKNTLAYLKSYDKKYSDNARLIEDKLNRLDEEITHYLVKIFPYSFSVYDSNSLQVLLNIVGDFERIGDHCDNVVEQVDFMLEQDAKLSDEAREELFEMFELTIEAVRLAVTALRTNDFNIAYSVYEVESTIDQMERDLRKRHIRRLNLVECSPKSGLVFTDIISNLERVGDHAQNVVELLFEQD